MIGWESWAIFLGYAVPMIVSPGPGNTLLATAGGRYGLRGSMPFWIAFVILGLFCHFPWIYGGQVILGRFNSPQAVRIQAAVFGISMLAVAAYVVLS
ncbi:hypothetical protein A9973_14105 [Achromobacter sp. UMC46]|nr:hypothetical protein [Achromobacter sp. UMC46]